MSLSESHIEQNLIDLLKNQGYEYYYWPDISPFGSCPMRTGFDMPILESVLEASLVRLNPDVPASARAEALAKVRRMATTDIMANNEAFQEMLTDGVSVEYFKDGQTIGMNIRLMDVIRVENNSFYAVNQFVIKENQNEKRLDVVLFINGLPLVVIELKNPIDKDATLERAFTQIQNYKKAVPSIFYYNALCIISDGMDARVSSVSAPYSRYLVWKSPDKVNFSNGKRENTLGWKMENGRLPELQILAERLLEKKTLLEVIRYNTVFEKEEVKDKDTGILSRVTVKKVAAYHQYYAVEKAIKETIRATSETGDNKIGVVWHTQGSGKSLSMVILYGEIGSRARDEKPDYCYPYRPQWFGWTIIYNIWKL